METPNVPTSAPAANVNAPKPVTPVDANAVKPDANATPAEVRKFKIKDQEYDEKTLERLIEKGNGADKKFQEVAAQRKEIERVLYNLKTNPGKVLLNKSLGHNPAAVIREITREAAEAGFDVNELKKALSEVMYEWIQDEQMDPKEKEIRELKKQLEKREAADKQVKEEQDQAILKDLTTKAYKTLDEDITSALKTSGLPKSTFTVKRMAYHLDQAYKLKQQYEAQGVKVRDPKAADIVSYVRKDYDTMFRDLYQSADVETLIQLIGEDNVNRIREFDVNKFRQGGSPAPKSPLTPKNPMEKKATPPAKTGGKNFLKEREEEIRRMEKGL
jgi:hypothetical protein